MYFDNLAQATVEDRVVVNKLTTAKITPTEQAALYTNPLSTKEADNVALQTAMKKLKMEVKTSAPKLPPSIGQATSRGASTTKHRGEDLIQSGRERGNPPTPPGGALHTVGAMGREVTQEQNSRERSQTTKPGLMQEKGQEAPHLAFHRTSDG